MKNMAKELKDYLHLYLGCAVHDLFDDDTKVLYSVCYGENICYLKSKNGVIHKRKIEEIEISLRPLSDMTEEEKGNVCGTDWTYTDGGWEYTPETFLFLLSKHFDLFGLIDGGLAIDKTTLIPTP